LTIEKDNHNNNDEDEDKKQGRNYKRNVSEGLLGR
jgi:hypothetical protein